MSTSIRSFREDLQEVIELELLSVDDVTPNKGGKGLLVSLEDGTKFQLVIECLTSDDEVGDDDGDEQGWDNGDPDDG
jgi:hypothetical protein